MTDAPKHPTNPDPANELASDQFADRSAGFSQCARHLRHRRHHHHGRRGRRKALWADLQFVCFGVAESAAGALEPGDVFSSLSIFQNASHFAVNVLGASQQALANKFAKSSDDKFAGVEWTPGLGNAPLLADSVANFQCRAANRYYGGDHVIFLGAVEAYSYNRQEPLLFARGGYGRFLGRRHFGGRQVMSKKAPPKRARAKQKRLSPDDRRKEFVAKATEFFSEEGFGGGTRDLARRLGVTQPLLYRYFPSKDDLIKEVYRTVYLEPLDTGWEKLLTDRSRPIRDRLQEFYNAYTKVIFTRKWLRIYLYSGLKGLDINRWYVGVVRDKILTRIIRECRHEAGLPVQSKPTASELEMAWVFHSGIFYYGVRKYIYESPVLEDKEQMISDALDVFLAGFERVFGTSGRPRRARR